VELELLGARHVVKITSKASSDSPIARRRGQDQIENRLIASGLAYTLLRNNAYMQNFLMLAPTIVSSDSFASPTGDGRVGMIDTRDVAAVAAEIAASPGPHAGKTYWPTGPERLSSADAARVQAMINAGLPEVVADDNAKALTLFADGDADYVTDDVPVLLGRPARSFEQFVTDFAVAFS